MGAPVTAPLIVDFTSPIAQRFISLAFRNPYSITSAAVDSYTKSLLNRRHIQLVADSRELLYAIS